MNPIRQIEEIKAMHKAGALTAHNTHMALHSPLFIVEKTIYEALTPDEVSFLHQHVLDENNNLRNPPFRCFRMTHPKSDFTLLVFANKPEDGGLWFVTMVDGIPKERTWMFCTPGEQKRWAVVAFRAGRPVEPRFSEKYTADDYTTWFIRDPLIELGRICFDLAIHSSVAVRVEPQRKPGKSVEWVLARTHYLVVNRKIAQRMSRELRGPSDHEIKRAAHYRIAHLRRLCNPKFRFKVGQLVPVKEAWVGPKEWHGLDGKIYRVMDDSV